MRPNFTLGQHVWVRMGPASTAVGLIHSLPDDDGYVRVEWPPPSAWGVEVFHKSDVEPMFEEGGERLSRFSRRRRKETDAYSPPMKAEARDTSQIKAATKTTSTVTSIKSKKSPKKKVSSRTPEKVSRNRLKESPKKKAMAQVKRKFANRRAVPIHAGDLGRNVWVVNGRTQHAATLVSKLDNGTIRIRWHTTLNFDDVDPVNVTPMFPRDGSRSGGGSGRTDRLGPAAPTKSVRTRSDHKKTAGVLAPRRSSGRKRIATDYYKPPNPSDGARVSQSRTAKPSPKFWKASVSRSDRRRTGTAGVPAPTRSSGRRRVATDFYKPPDSTEGTRKSHARTETLSPKANTKSAERKAPVRKKRGGAGRPTVRPEARPSTQSLPPLYSHYMRPVERTNCEVGGSGMVLRRTTVAPNLLRFRASTFRLRLHGRIVMLERWGRVDEALKLLRELHEHEREGREGEGPERLMREILGEDYGADDDLEILDGGSRKSESLDSSAARCPSVDIIDLCNVGESDESESNKAAVKPAAAKLATPIKVKTEKCLSSVDADFSSESSDDESSADDFGEAWSGSVASDDSDATMPYTAPKKSQRMPGGDDRTSAGRHPPQGSFL